MEIKAQLNKPYSDKQRADFIVENNHNKGYDIKETETALLAIYEEPTVDQLLEEKRQARSLAYQQEVDPITCHINRLLDEEPTEETLAKIAELKQERSDKVEEIKARYPYPVL